LFVNNYISTFFISAVSSELASDLQFWRHRHWLASAASLFSVTAIISAVLADAGWRWLPHRLVLASIGFRRNL
jgi:DNA-binding transcriptional LysR family regulator